MVPTTTPRTPTRIPTTTPSPATPTSPVVPPTTTTESAILTRWNGQLYVVLGEQLEDGRWQMRIWWKPFVTLIWFGGLLIALGGVLTLIGRERRGWALKLRKSASWEEMA